MSTAPRPFRAALGSAAAAALLAGGSLVVLAAPSSAVTTAVTGSPATTTTQTAQTGTTGTTSTSCYTQPPLTASPPGTVLRRIDFEDGTTGGVSATTSTYDGAVPTLRNTTEAAHGGSRALRVDGLSESNGISVYFPAPSWGSFQFTAWVRLPAGSPDTRIRLSPSGSVVLASAQRATPITWTELAGRATPGTVFKDWYCNGRMTGTQSPAPVTVSLALDRSCDTGPYSGSLILDDLSMTVLTSSTVGNTTSGSWGPPPACGTTTTTTTTSTTTTTTSTTTARPAGSCQVRYRVDGRWPGGFVASVEVRNTGTSPLPAWELRWSYPDDERITSSWQASVSQSGRDVTVRPQPAAGLAAGAAASFGFLGDTGTPATPAAFTLSGRTCTVV